MSLYLITRKTCGETLPAFRTGVIRLRGCFFRLKGSTHFLPLMLQDCLPAMPQSLCPRFQVAFKLKPHQRKELRVTKVSLMADPGEGRGSLGELIGCSCEFQESARWQNHPGLLGPASM